MDEKHGNIRRIMVAVNEIDGACARISKIIGVKENTLTLLYALDDGRPHSQKEICEEWFLPKTTLNTIVKECVKAGLVVLNRSGGTKEKEICLTDTGRSYAASVLSQVYALEDRAMGDLSPDFISALSLFANALKKEARRFGA